LKGVCDKKLAEAFIFDSGKLQWSEFTAWPPKEIGITRLNIAENGLLKINGKQNTDLKFTYVSDPKNPIPYRSETEGLVFTPRAYMTDDQRHCSKRTDVLTFQTEILGEDFTLPEGDKAPFQQMTFTLADEQATVIKNAIDDIKGTDEYKYAETMGNENSNGNALYLIIMQWAEQRK
jgi:predicted acyl esterase